MMRGITSEILVLLYTIVSGGPLHNDFAFVILSVYFSGRRAGGRGTGVLDFEIHPHRLVSGQD